MSLKIISSPSLTKAKMYNHLVPLRPMLPYIPYNGIYFPTLVDTNKYNYYKDNFVFKENDILLATYPKCGTHLLKKTVIEIARAYDGGKNVDDLYKTGDFGTNPCPWMEYFFGGGILNDNEINERITMTDDIYPRLWASHASFENLCIKSFHTNSKIIVMCRNPKDQIVSAASFYSKWNEQFEGINENLTISDTLSYFIRGITAGGCYFKYYETYFNLLKLNKYNILWLYYEDMINYPIENIKKITQFIYDNKNEKSMYKFHENDYEQILQRTKFEYMKNESINNPQSHEVNDLFRKGINNDWINHLTQQESQLIDETMYFKWAQNCSDIKYYKDIMEKYNDTYNKGYF
eukprot:153365_1